MTNGEAIYDTTNHYGLTVEGHTHSGTNKNINTSSNITILGSQTYTVTVSQTQSTNISISGYLHAIDYLDTDDMGVSSSFDIPATGVPKAHPTVTAGTYNFGSTTQTVSFVVTGGVAYHIDHADVDIYTTRTGTTQKYTYVATITSSGTTRYCGLTDAQIHQILAYWEGSDAGGNYEITQIGIRVTTHYDDGSGTKDHPAVFLLPPAFATAYNTTSYSVARGPLVNDPPDDTNPQSHTAVVTQATNCPFYQHSLWPANIAIRLWRGTTELTSLGSSFTRPTKTWTKDDAFDLAVTSTQTCYARLYNNATQDTETVFTVQASDSFITLKRGASMADHQIGICTGTPTYGTLDINGTLTARKNSHVYAHQNGSQSIADQTNVPINFNVEVYDNNAEFAASSGKFTAIHGGFYHFSFSIMSNSMAWTGSHYWMASVLKNGTHMAWGIHDRFAGTGTRMSSLNMTCWLSPGDYLEFCAYHNYGSAVSTITNQPYNFVTIDRIA